MSWNGRVSEEEVMLTSMADRYSGCCIGLLIVVLIILLILVLVL